MKRKFLSIAICLMLCFTSVFMLSACKEKPEKISIDEAAAAFETAMVAMEEAESIKLTMNVPGFGNMVCIGNEEGSYVRFYSRVVSEGVVYVIDVEDWVTQEDSWVNYSLMTMQEGDEDPVVVANKSVLLEMESMFENENLEGLDSMDFSNFVEATTLNGEISIVFSADGMTLTAKIVGGKLVSVTTMGPMGAPITIYFSYGNFISEIPEIPEDSADLTWDMISEIVVEGVPEVFEQGTTLDIETLTLKFYETGYSAYDEYVEIELTQDMISQTEDGYVVTYLGLTFEIPYTVPAE